jgi:parallel beta-helix repeat protein
LTDATLIGCCLEAATLDEVRWERGRGEQTAFSGASLRGASLQKSEFVECDVRTVSEWTMCQLFGTHWTRCDLRGINLSGTDFSPEQVDLTECCVDGVTVNGEWRERHIVVNGSEVPVTSRFVGVRVVSTISEGIDAATSGMTLYVLPGEYHESLVIEKDITLARWGCTSTGGIGAEEGAHGVSVIGSDERSAVIIKGCKATLRGLVLETGVHVVGSSGWTIEECRVSGNANGIVVTDGTGTIRACSVSECGVSGVFVEGSANVIVERCAIVGNKCHGVEVIGKAHARLVECHCLRNESCGVLTAGESYATVERCKMGQSKNSGVGASDQSQVRLVRSECVDNDASGVVSFGTTTVDAESCVMTRNKSYGVSVQGQSKAQIVECDCEENVQDGIRVGDESGAELKQCKLMRNKSYGMSVRDKARVRMAECECVGNEKAGLMTVGQSSTVAERCKMILNMVNGALMKDKSKLQLISCECAGNSLSGVATKDNSKCFAEQCAFINNGEYGASRTSESSSLVMSRCQLTGNRAGERENC